MADKADKEKSKPKSVLGGKKSPKKHVKEAHVRHAANGGYIIKHIHDQPEPMSGEPGVPDEEHTAPDMEALQQHMQDNMSQEGQGQGDPSAGSGEPAPMPQG